MEEASVYHKPVLLAEAMEWLQIREDGTYVDATFGGGGHSREIIKRLGERGKLLVFDQDEDAARNVWEDERMIYVPHNFRFLKRYLKYYQVKEVDGLLADLGVSSHQFDAAKRGFSFRFDTKLDMRMNQSSQLTAAEILNQYDEARLHYLLGHYGEVTNAKSLAAFIVQSRLHHVFDTTQDFVQRINHLIRGNRHQYLAKVFQALRIEVNDEMGALQELLASIYDILKPGGRAVIITYHSLEDRMVKNLFKTGNIRGEQQKDFYGNTKNYFHILTKKALSASLDEQKQNTRSRSAKLRAAEKI